MTIAEQFEARGFQKGYQEGYQKECRRVAIELIQRKWLPDEQIAKVTGLSQETVQDLKRQVTMR